MKQRDHHLAVASSSLSFTASESDPEDSFWRDFTFDFSFLTSDDQKSGGLGDDNALPKESELYGLAVVDSSVTATAQVAKNDSIAKAKGKEACYVPSSTTTALNLRRSRDDLNVLYGLNPMAPQFIPSNAKTNLDKNGREFGGNGSPSLKRSLSSTFPPASGEFSANDLYEAGIEQQNSIMDESLGLVCHDTVSEAMGVLGITISHEFQRPKKLDPLAPVFVPAYDKSGAAGRMMASEVGHIGSISSKTYSSNPRCGPQVHVSENTELDSSSNKTHGLKKKLNPLAPHFSLADTKPNVFGSVGSQAAHDLPTNVNSSVLLSPVGYRNHKELYPGFAQPSVHIKQMGRHSPNILNGNLSPQMDVKKLLTTIHGLSELLTHVHGSPDEQDLDLINSTVQNLNSYINNRVQEHTGNYDGLTSLPNMCKQSISEHQIPKARNLSSTVDFRRKEKYPMVKRETGAEPQIEYVVTKENGFGQVVASHETEEQIINPQGLFYKSLWLKARADRSLMEYETFLSSSRT